MLRTQNFWMHFPQGVLCKLLYFYYFRVFFRYFYFTLTFTIFITCLIYRKPISIAFLSNVNVRFRWEHWKDQRQLSSVIYVLHEKWWILCSSLLLFLTCVLSNFFKSTPDSPSVLAHETAPYSFKNLLSEVLFPLA